MASKKTTHRESKTQVENSAQKLKKEGRAHQKGEIISRDELEKRGGLTGDPTALLAVYLHKFEEGEAHVNYSKNINGKTICETYTKRFVKLLALLTQNEMYISNFIIFKFTSKPPKAPSIVSQSFSSILFIFMIQPNIL